MAILSTFRNCYLIILPCLFFIADIPAQTIGSFSSVSPGPQTENFLIPTTHTFQRLIKTGDPLTLGGTLGSNLDFTGYVPISGSSRNGYVSISSETTPAECAILEVYYDYPTHTWNTGTSGKVPFSIGTATSDLGNVSRFCSGTITPRNTIMVCEETTSGGNINSSVDGYEDVGWVIEINPVTRTVIDHNGDGRSDKLWALGRQAHENVAIKSDESVLYWGADANPTGYLYKFVPTIAGNYTSGTLYVLHTTAALGSGSWVELLNPSSTVANRNNTVGLSAGAYNFNGIEDAEIGPDGKIYFAAKGPGVVYRLSDDGTTVNNLEVFVASVNYDVDGPGPLGTEPWGTGNDNLAFDMEGNLWVLQDGSRNHIWVVAPTHTAAAPQIRLFGKTPAGSEPTGITFTPDNKFMFISFQHPSSGNTAVQTDAAGNSVIFNTSTTVVVARTEALGPLATLPVTFTNFSLKPISNGIVIEWSVAQAFNHSHFAIERSADGSHFEEIYRNHEIVTDYESRSFKYTDHSLRTAKVFYRIKQSDKNGSIRFTEIRSLTWKDTDLPVIFPVPATNYVNIRYTSGEETKIYISIVDQSGRSMQKEKRKVIKGINNIVMNIQKLSKGNYSLIIRDGERKSHYSFVKF